jgi:hypothetical protein
MCNPAQTRDVHRNVLETYCTASPGYATGGKRKYGSRKVVLVPVDEVATQPNPNALRSEGYEVLADDDRNEAPGLSRDHEATIDLLLTDVAMPHVDGIIGVFGDSNTSTNL